MIKFKIAQQKGYDDDDDDRERIQRCVAKLEKVMNSAVFRRLVTNFTVNGRRQFLQSGGLNNEEVLEALLHGVATNRGRKAHTARLKLILEPGAGGSCVGFARAGRVHTYRSFFDRHADSWMVGHLAHEYAHLAGFTHTAHWTPSRKNTVPYAIGELAFEACHHIWPNAEADSWKIRLACAARKTWLGQKICYWFF